MLGVHLVGAEAAGQIEGAYPSVAYAKRDDDGISVATTPRRTAMTGLAGLAALGAAALVPGNATGKKSKGKAKGKGRKPRGALIRIVVEESGELVPENGTDEAIALCPAPRPEENVFVLGGCFVVTSALMVVVRAQSVTEGGDVGYAVEVHNSSDLSQNVTAQAICGYFRT